MVEKKVVPLINMPTEDLANLLGIKAFKLLGFEALPHISQCDFEGKDNNGNPIILSTKVDEIASTKTISITRIATLDNTFIRCYWLIHKNNKYTLYTYYQNNKIPLFIVEKLTKVLSERLGPVDLVVDDTLEIVTLKTYVGANVKVKRTPKTKVKVKLFKMNMPDLAKTLKQESLPTLNKNDLAGQSLRVDEVADNGNINVRRIVTLSNEYVNHYWLIYSYDKQAYTLVCHGDKPMFVMGDLTKTIQDIVGPFTWDNDETNPVNLNYYSPFKLENKNYILKDSTVLPINWLSRIEYEGLDSAQRKLVKELVGEEREELSPLLHTNKTLKYIKTGRQPETYFHESAGQYFPRHQSEEVSKKYKYHDNIMATETWCTSPHADIHTMYAPEPEVIIYEKSWNQLTQSYMKGRKVTEIQLTQFIQQNLVEGYQNNELKIFETKNLKFLTAEAGEILFPVNYTPVSYAEHNKRHSEALNELHIWLNENMGEMFEENIYSSIKQYLDFNMISGIAKISKATAVTRCLKLKIYCGFEKSYLADIEVKSTAYIALFRKAGDGIELIYAVPYRNHSTYYENYKEDEDGNVKANNKEIRQIKLEKAAYESYLTDDPKVIKELTFLISKLV